MAEEIIMSEATQENRLQNRSNASVFVNPSLYGESERMGAAESASLAAETQSEEDINAAVMEIAHSHPETILTRQEGFDILIDGVGYASSVNQVLPLMKPHFTVGVYGWAERFHYALNPFLSEHSFRCYCDGYDEAESHDEVVADMLAGKLDASLYYDLEHPVPLTQIADA